MSKESTLHSTGKMGNTAFADKFIEILQKQGNTKPAMAETAVSMPETPVEKTETAKEIIPISTSLPTASDINKIGTVLDEAVLAELRRKAQDEKVVVDGVGKKLWETRKKIEEVKSDPELKGTSVGEAVLAALREDLAKLKSYGDEHFQKRAEGFALVEEVRAINPEHIGQVREIYSRVVALGYRRLVSKKEIDEVQAAKRRLEGLIFFEGKTTISVFQGEEKNGFYRALEAELRKLTDKAKVSKAAIIAAVNPDLTGYGHGKPGAYQFVSPYHKGEDGREYFEGRVIVKLFDINRDRGSRPYIKVEITKATGSLGWVENQPGKRPVPLDWVRNGEIPSDKKNEMTSDQVKYAEKVIFNLRRIYGNWRRGLNPEAAKPKEERPEGPIYTTPADNSGVVVEKVTSYKPAISLGEVLEKVSSVPLLASEKKTKKAKKA